MSATWQTAAAWADADGAARVRDLAEGTFSPGIGVIASAPGRVNLIGEHVDYNGGTVLPIALPHRTFAALRRRPDRTVRHRRTGARTDQTTERSPE